MVRRLNLRQIPQVPQKEGKVVGHKGVSREQCGSLKRKNKYCFRTISSCIVEILQKSCSACTCPWFPLLHTLVLSSPSFIPLFHKYSQSKNLLYIGFLTQCGLGLENYLLLPCLFILKPYLILNYHLHTLSQNLRMVWVRRDS